MYLLPAPMRPDTFSQYGYADAGNLRSLRRGYGHDIYPQYPTTYNMPRLVAGLGAFTKNNYTIKYYANPGDLSFADKGMKKLYEGLRNADADFQINLFKIKKALQPAFGMIEVLTAGNVKAADIKKALSLKLPTWGVALFLEVAAGKRPLDKGFKAVMQVAAEDAAASAAVFGILTGVNVAAIAAAGPFPPLVPLLPVTLTLAGIAGTGTAVCAIIQPIFSSLAKGKPPTRKQMKDMMEGAARLSGQKLPSSTELDKISGEFEKAQKKFDAAQKTPSTDKGNPALQVKPVITQPTLPGSPARVDEPPASKPFPVVPVALVAAALVGGAFFATRKGK